MSTNRASRANDLRHITYKGSTLPALTTGYIACLLWVGIGEDYDGQIHNIDDAPSIFCVSNIADSAMCQIIADCESFAQHRALWDGKETDWTVGAQFYLTRNRHGSGFWDSPEIWEESTDELTALAHSFGEYEIYFDDGGMIHGL